jgi:hypothetical protein
MRALTLVALVVAVMGCGSGGGSGTPTGGGPGGGGTGHQPVDHALATDAPESMPAQTQLTLGTFTVPAAAIATYTIIDTPYGVGPDTMDVGVATAASAQTSSPVAYGIQQNVSSTSGSTQPLPAGDYALLVQCVNLVDNCVFEVSLTATY